MNYFKEILKGISWMEMLRFSTRILSFFRIFILARLLTPSQFGVYAVATIGLTFLEGISETGLSVFFIQRSGTLKKYLNTAWSISIIRGVVISLSLIIITPLIVVFFNAPDARDLIYIIAIAPLVKGFINPSLVLFQKNMKFKNEYFVRICVFLVEITVSITVTAMTHSPIGIVFGIIGGSIAELVISFLVVKQRPVFALDLVRVKTVVNRSVWVSIYKFFDYVFTQIDDIVVGKIFGYGVLGVYQMGYKVASLPVSEITDTVGLVTLPGLSKINSKKERMRVFIRILLLTTLAVLPFSGLFYFYSDSIVIFILGNRWIEVAPIIRGLALLGIVRGLYGPVSALLLSFNRQEYVAIMTVSSTVILVFTIVPLAKYYGLYGVFISVYLGMAIVWPLAIWFLNKIFK